MDNLLPVGETGKLHIPDHIKKVKLDVGLSYDAPHSNWWILNDPNDLYVFGFEPNSDAIMQIKGLQPRQSEHLNRLDTKFLETNMTIVNVALGKECKNVDFYITSGDVGCSSVYKPVDFHVQKKTTVQQLTLEQFFEVFPWDRFGYIEYLKIDAQGSDLDIVIGAGEYIKRIVYVTLECEQNQYHGTTNDEASADAYMSSMGFARIVHPNTNDPTYLNKSLEALAPCIFIKQTC